MKSCMQLVLTCVVMLLLLPCLLLAAEGSEVYVIQKGDTLWGLSGRFLNDPGYWPNLWSKNPQVTNPHLIYPGQTVRFVDGRMEIVPVAVPVTKAPTALQVPQSDQEVVEEQLFRVRGNEGWLLEKDLASVGRIIAGEQSRMVLGEDDTVFTDIGSLHGGSDGSTYTILRSSALIKHPVTREEIGYKVYPLGSLQLTKVTLNNSRGIITSSYKEVEPGDLLVPFQQLQRKNISLKVASRPLNGFIVESSTGNNSLAAGDVVYLDLGEAQGIEPGNLLYIIRKVAVEKMLVERYVGQLPSEVVGALVVVDVGNNTSTAIIVKSIDAIFKGSEVVDAPH